MKKYNILFAIIALLFASLACKTLMSGGAPNIAPPGDNGGIPTKPPGFPTGSGGPIPTLPVVATDESGNITVGGKSPFPTPSDAFNVVSTPEMVTFQTKLSADDVMKFYRNAFKELGYTEDTSVTTNFNGIIAMAFKGDGKTVILGGTPAGDGSMSVTLTYQK